MLLPSDWISGAKLMRRWKIDCVQLWDLMKDGLPAYRKLSHDKPIIFDENDSSIKDRLPYLDFYIDDVKKFEKKCPGLKRLKSFSLNPATTRKQKIKIISAPTENTCPEIQSAKSDSPKKGRKTRIKQPKDHEIQAYRICIMTEKTQEEVATEMKARTGRSWDQSKVSRAYNKVRKFIDAGNVLPGSDDIISPKLKKKIVTTEKLDKIDWTPRQDGHSWKRSPINPDKSEDD